MTHHNRLKECNKKAEATTLFYQCCPHSLFLSLLQQVAMLSHILQ